MKTIIYDSDSIQVIADLFPAKIVVYSFSNFVAAGLARPSYGLGFLQKNGFAAIFIDAKYNHWWQVADLHLALAAAQEAAAGYERQVSYGNSMGGYGALLCAGTLQSIPVALSPQCQIGDPSLPLVRAWRAEIAMRPILNDDVRSSLASVSEAFIVSDPRDKIDKLQIRSVADVPSVQLIKTPFATHKVPAFLREIGVVGAVVSSLIRGDFDPHAFRQVCRAKRRLSGTYFLAVMRACLDGKKMKSLAIVIASAQAAVAVHPDAEEAKRILAGIEQYAKHLD